MVISVHIYLLTLEYDERFELKTAGSETYCDSAMLRAILCDTDVHSPGADCVDRPRRMHGEVDWSLVHVNDVPAITVRLIDSWTRDIDHEVFSGSCHRLGRRLSLVRTRANGEMILRHPARHRLSTGSIRLGGKCRVSTQQPTRFHNNHLS